MLREPTDVVLIPDLRAVHMHVKNAARAFN